MNYSMEKMNIVWDITTFEERNGYVIVPDKWSITEKETGFVIKENLDNVEARKLLRHLNLGGGFDGWTPNFFMKKVDIKFLEA
jgi:hypothetical protein